MKAENLTSQERECPFCGHVATIAQVKNAVPEGQFPTGKIVCSACNHGFGIMYQDLMSDAEFNAACDALLGGK